MPTNDDAIREAALLALRAARLSKNNILWLEPLCSRLVQQAVEAEREACAVMVDSAAGPFVGATRDRLRHLAAAIRAREGE